MFDTIIRGGTIVDGTGEPPWSGDIAVDQGVIVAVGDVSGPARREIDASGALVTPGWIDGHTHYDGQVTWDNLLEGSASNGVTTAIMGNCGVGFAPVRPGDAEALVDLMEGVEDIPGTALFEGMPWGEWETFPEYVELLSRSQFALDIGAQIAHGPLRYYVMRDRAIGNTTATADDLSEMATIVEQAVRAGALGFSTSRVQGHRSMSGHTVPGTDANVDELIAIGQALRAGGGGVFQAVPSSTIGDIPDLTPEHSPLLDELKLLSHISREAGQAVTFTMFQRNDAPDMWQEELALVAAENSSGARLFPMVAPRATTLLTTLRSYHVFMRRPTYQRLSTLPHDELVAALQRPETKAAILAEDDEVHPVAGSNENTLGPLLRSALPNTFALREPLDYEPSLDQSMPRLAAAAGVDLDSYVYDFLLEDNGQSVGLVLGFNYAGGNLDACRSMLLDPTTVSGNSDAGAHVNFVCDMSMPTFNLMHWVRDRSRGEKLPVELMVAKGTSSLANLYGLTDRGTLSVGKRADINVVDLDNLTIQRPKLQFDLPAGGSRFLQCSTGYVMTMVAGAVVRADDQDTGARPGTIIRAAR